MIYAFIAGRCADLPVAQCCTTMKASRSAFYAWQHRQANPTTKMLADAELGELVVKVHDQSFGTYGVLRVTAELRLGLGRNVNHKRVQRLMRERGLTGVTRRRRSKGCTRSRANDPRSDDLVHRQFRPEHPDRLWVQDVTQHRTAEGWVYLAVVIDAWSRRVVGWSIADHMRAELVADAIDMATLRRRPPNGTIAHSDHGSNGGINWLSQHLDDGGGRDGNDEGAAAGGSALSGAGAVAGSANGGVATGSGQVLVGDRSRGEDRRCRERRGCVITGGISLVPPRWWREPMFAVDGVGPLPVLSGARGHRAPSSPRLRRARDRSPHGPQSVDDLA